VKSYRVLIKLLSQVVVNTSSASEVLLTLHHIHEVRVRDLLETHKAVNYSDLKHQRFHIVTNYERHQISTKNLIWITVRPSQRSSDSFWVVFIVESIDRINDRLKWISFSKQKSIKFLIYWRSNWLLVFLLGRIDFELHYISHEFV
jgi:hypothetical protein